MLSLGPKKFVLLHIFLAKCCDLARDNKLTNDVQLKLFNQQRPATHMLTEQLQIKTTEHMELNNSYWLSKSGDVGMNT